jgi:hypothetical protein
MGPLYWRRGVDGRSTMHMGDLTHRAYSPNASPVILRWGGKQAWWLLWMAEESACPPLASRKRGSDGRSAMWQIWGPFAEGR